MSNRINGRLGDAMIDAALHGLLTTMWEGRAGVLGLECDRSQWRRRMRHALENAFEELLKEPAP